MRAGLRVLSHRDRGVQDTETTLSSRGARYVATSRSEILGCAFGGKNLDLFANIKNSQVGKRDLSPHPCLPMS